MLIELRTTKLKQN